MTTTPNPSPELIAMRQKMAEKFRRRFTYSCAFKQGLQTKQKEDPLDKHYRYND